MIQKHLSNTTIYYWINEKKATETLLFIHAAFADHTSFDEQVIYFSEKYQVITLDLIGHGKSTVTKKGDSLEKTSDYTLQLLDVEEIDKVHLTSLRKKSPTSKREGTAAPMKVGDEFRLGVA